MKIKIFSCVTAVLGLFLGWSAFAQNTTVTGRVIDGTTNEPIVGAAVMVKGTNTGDVTQNDGTYSIKAPASAVLICQFFGYKTIEEPLNGRSKVDFILVEDTETLEATVVVGYGTLKKTQLVGSVENLDGKVLADRPNSNVTRSLQGQIAGLNIIQTDGKASHSGSVYIRGGKTSYNTRSSATSASGAGHSIGNGGGALVLIDGVEGSLGQVNPNDIETISVLKDASSSAIYGARAAYGVILVTTKEAKGDKVSVTYSGSYSLNERLIKWEDHIVSDGLEWLEAFYDFYGNDTRVPGASGKVPTTINTQDVAMSGTTYLDSYRAIAAARAEGMEYNEYGVLPDDPTGYALGSKGQFLYYGNTNWLNFFYKRHYGSQTHDISVRGNSKKVNYNITGRYYGQDGIYKIGQENYNTFNLRAKGRIKINDWLSLENNTSVFRSKQTQPMFTTGSLVGHQVDQHGQPVLVPYNADGSFALASSKTSYTAFLEGNTGQDDSNLTLTTTTALTLDIIKDVLKVKGDFSYRAIRRWRERYRAPLTFYSAPEKPTYYVTQESSYKSRWTYDTDHLTANIVATWTPKLGENHDLNVVGGWNLEDYQYDRFYLQRKGMLFPEKYKSFELFDGTDIKVEQNDQSYGIVGFFGRANYTLLRRYIAEFSARYDGSSKFPSSQQWGFFPSASFGWRLSEEPFMKWSRSWLDNFKIRANWGSLGNGTVAPYTFLETMGVDKTSVVIGGVKANYTTQPSPIPESLTWEKVTTYDIGIDADFLHSRLSFSGDIYRRNTTDLIVVGPELPGLYGADPPKGNYGALKTDGWELTLSWRDQFNVAGKPFEYSIKGSLWDSRTWVTEYGSTTHTLWGYYEGKELGEIWGFRTDGIFRDNEEANNWATDSFHKNGSNFRAYAGDLKFVDLDGDGDINYGKAIIEDSGDLTRIGNALPRFQYGINLDFRWNGIGLSMFFQGVGKRDWYPTVETGFFWGQYNRPYSPYLTYTQTGNNYAHVDYSTTNWVVTNYDDNPYWSRRVGYSANRNVGPLTYENDHYLQNVAYIRLKNLTIDYSLPSKWLKKIDISAARFYVSMENLWTWSPLFKHTDMFDPEVISIGDSDFDSTGSSYYGLSGVGEGYSYPMLRTFTFGVNLTF
ncbi:MAG: TonB-dependent receptor [Bacteroidales bacterium]|nr:TonB-dependent receptor [Bacteroidales bacterium]